MAPDPPRGSRLTWRILPTIIISWSQFLRYAPPHAKCKLRTCYRSDCITTLVNRRVVNCRIVSNGDRRAKHCARNTTRPKEEQGCVLFNKSFKKKILSVSLCETFLIVFCLEDNMYMPFSFMKPYSAVHQQSIERKLRSLFVPDQVNRA